MIKNLQGLACAPLFTCLVLLAPVMPAVVHAASAGDKVEQLGKPDFLVVDEIRATRRNGLLMIQATIVNTDNQSRHMRYRFRWIDTQGFDVGPEESWKPLVVHGKQSQRIQTIAPTPQATDFSLQIHADENDANPDSSEPTE